jgi:hypothetical protein
MKLTITLAATLSTFTTAARYDFTFDGECNYAALKASTEDTDVSPEKLISLLTYGGDDEVEAEAMTEILCEMARADNSNPRRGACKYTLECRPFLRTILDAFCFVSVILLFHTIIQH